jgi:hypothetical protein
MGANNLRFRTSSLIVLTRGWPNSDNHQSLNLTITKEMWDSDEILLVGSLVIVALILLAVWLSSSARVSVKMAHQTEFIQATDGLYVYFFTVLNGQRIAGPAYRINGTTFVLIPATTRPAADKLIYDTLPPRQSPVSTSSSSISVTV